MENKKREVVIKRNGEVRILRPMNTNQNNNRTAPQVPKKKQYSEFSFCLNSQCRRRFHPNVAIANGHDGYCKKSCVNQTWFGPAPRKKKLKTLKKIRQKFKQRERQIRRNRKTQTSVGFYESDAWRDLRFKILRKFGMACMACGRNRKTHGVILHVDHIKPRSKYPQLELDPENLQVLCEDCNIGKSNHSEEDLRPKLPGQS